MKVEQKIIFEVEKNEKIFRFEIPHDAHLADAYQSAYEFTNRVLASIVQAHEKLKPKNENDIEKEEKEEKDE